MGSARGRGASVSVCYLGHQVVVRAEKERVVQRVAHSFAAMLAAGPALSCEVLEIRPDGENHVLLCDGAPVFVDADPGEVQRTLRHEIIRAFVRAHPHLLWLHAGAAVRDGRAVLFVGPYGRGKSTLVTRLCARGWSYVSDDVVPVDLCAGRVLPFPLTPIVREAVAEELPPERVSELRKVKVALPRERYHRDPVPIGGVVLPAYRAGVGARAQPYSPAAVALDIVREGINREQHGQASVALCARLVGEVPVLPLLFSDAEAAADLVEQRLAERPGR